MPIGIPEMYLTGNEETIVFEFGIVFGEIFDSHFAMYLCKATRWKLKAESTNWTDVWMKTEESWS